MFRKLNRKTFGLAASLVLAGGAIVGTAASAQYASPPPAGCSDLFFSECNSHWENWGYTSHWDCTVTETCQLCPDTDNINCPAINWIDNNEVSRHDSHGH
jgi:hypothetical protein